MAGWIAQWRETSQMPVWSYMPFQRPDFSMSNELKMKEACMEKYLEQLGACQPATIPCEPGTWDQLDETVRSWHSSVAASCSSSCLIFVFFSFFFVDVSPAEQNAGKLTAATPSRATLSD